ncbi:MAG: DUF1559 domain-containing protein [Pirellula sp.]
MGGLIGIPRAVIRRAAIRSAFAVFLTGSLFLSVPLLNAQLNAQEVAQKIAPPERFGDIPGDSIGAFSLEFGKMRLIKDFELWPWEVLDVAAKEQFGIQLDQIEAIDGMVLMPSPDPEFGLSIRTKVPFDIADLSDQILTPVEQGAKDAQMRFRDFSENPLMRVMQREPQRVLLGTQGALRRMTSSRLQPGGEFIGLVQNSPAMFKMAVNFESLRDLVSAFVLTEENQIPPELSEEMEQIIDLTDNVLVELYRDPANALRVSLGTSGADKTELLSKSLLRVRRQLTDLVMEQSTQGMEFDDSVSVEMKQALTSYMNRIRKYIDNESMWSIQEDRVVMQFESSMLVNYQIIGVLSGLLLPAVQAARESARQMQSSNNLRQIMLAMHNYHDANGKFPAQAIAQGDGNPLLSWRVAILPYLGEQALYDQFHLDEPWDSEHNIALLEQMPEFFRNPSNPPSAGMTTYLVPMGKGVGLSSEGLKMQEITDGTANTLAVLDVDPQFGVPWTKPDDLDIRQNEVLDWLRAEGSNAGFFDGSVRIIDLEIDTEVLEAMMTRAGGEVVSFMPP